jgi:hypothetical protein
MLAERYEAPLIEFPGDHQGVISRAFANYFGARRAAVRRTAHLLCGDPH